MITKPEDWRHSSYRDLITNDNFLRDYLPEISIANKESYRKFVENNRDYQRKLGLIKKLIFK